MSKWHSHICETSIHRFSFQDDLLLFNDKTQELILLNQTSKIIWEGLDAGYSKNKIIQILSKATGADPMLIRSDVDSILSQWRDLDFFKNRRTSKHLQASPKDSNIHQETFDINQSMPARSDKTYSCCFKVIDTIFKFNTSDKDCLNLVFDHVSHFISKTKKNSPVTLDLVDTGTHFLLYKDEILVDRCSGKNGIIPMVHAMILMTAYDQSNCLLGIHASAVINKQGCILMPAASGSGKSTLTAAMIKSDFSYGADDLVLLYENPSQIIPVPSSMGFKEGSWPIIEALYPEIKTCREHMRADKKSIRYLPMKGKNLWSDTSSPSITADYIVYPSYTQDSPCRLEQISPAQSVINLSKAGFDIHKVLDQRLVQQLVDWIKSTPSFTLTFSNLDDAVARLKSMTE